MTSNPLYPPAATVVPATTAASPGNQASPYFGSTDRILVERAISELRAGRPVRINHDAGSHLVMAAEGAIARWEQLHTLFREDNAKQGPVLVLPAERLRFLGARSEGAASCDLANFADGAAEPLVFARSIEHLPKFRAATPLEGVALHLVRFTQLLPAAIVGQAADPRNVEWTLSVPLDGISRHHHQIATELTLVARTPVPLLDDAFAEFVAFRGSDGLKDQVAIIVGRPATDRPIPIRLHSACLTGDLFGSLKCDCGEQLRRAIRTFADIGGGVLLYLDQEGRGIGIGNKIRAYALQADGYDTVDADAVLGYGPDERRYEIAARMVALLGYRHVSILTNNPRKIAALKNHGIEVANRIALVGTVNPHNAGYLKAKIERAGHLTESTTELAS